MSDHRDAREALELAAVEPGGFDRLEAGDTPEAGLIAGHLAGCAECLEELARLRRVETLLRPLVASAPDPALRERTLAFVRAVGVPRSAHEDAPSPATSEPAPADAHVPSGDAGPSARPVLIGARRRAAAPRWLATVAAALVVGVLGGTLLAGGGSPAGNADPATALAAVTRETAALLGAGDAREVALRDQAGAAAGTLILSPSAGRIVVTAAGLPAPPKDGEYRCWVEVDGNRSVLGSMWRAGDVAWWSGDVALPAVLPPGVVYGISLVTEGSSAPGTVMLTGGL
jgi:hypothetical protein